MNKNYDQCRHQNTESSLSEKLDTDCLRRLYKEKGPITQDSLLAGLPEKTVPYHIDRADFVDNVIRRLIERNSITALFVLAAISWPDNVDLRSNLEIIVKEIKTPDLAIPDAWSALRRGNQERLERLWKELGPQPPGPPPTDENSKQLLPEQLMQNQLKDYAQEIPNSNEGKKKLKFQDILKDGIFDQIVECFKTKYYSNRLLKRIGFSTGKVPGSGNCLDFNDFWFEVCEEIENGKLKGGFEELLNAAAEQYPANEVFKSYKKTGD